MEIYHKIKKNVKNILLMVINIIRNLSLFRNVKKIVA